MDLNCVVICAFEILARMCTRQRVSRVSQQNKLSLDRLELMAILNSQLSIASSVKYGRTHNLTVEDLAWHAEEVCGGVGMCRSPLSNCVTALRVKDARQRRLSHTPTHAGTRAHTQEDLSNASGASHLE